MNKSNRDYPEDFQLENGLYDHICRTCQGKFVGHKRRYVCKMCVNKSSLFSKEELVQSSEYWLEKIQNKLYQELITYMETEGITTTKELAKRLQLPYKFISNVLKGNCNPSLKQLIKLSLALSKYPSIDFYKNRPVDIDLPFKDLEDEILDIVNENFWKLL